MRPPSPADEEPTEQMIGALMALCSVWVWQRMKQADLAGTQRRGIVVEILHSAIIVVRSIPVTRQGC